MRSKCKIVLSAVVLSCLTVGDSGAQGTFQNLNFESASLVPIPGDPYGRVQFGSAFTSWTGFVGGIQESSALYNNLFLDSSGISIIDSSFPYPATQGNYAAVLQAGNRLFTTDPADTALAQTGLVPLGTESLQFRVAGGVV